MASTSEAQLENSLIAQLDNQGWEKITLGNYDDLKQNFRNEFNRFNHKALLGNPLSDEEFRLLLAQIENLGVFASAKFLRDQQILVREDNTTIHYSLFNKEEWCNNHFQIASQVKTSGDRYNTRYDVTLLINGLPLVQIELKKSGVEVNEAFNQIQRYKNDNAYKGLFNFIQFFIISNGDYTRYFANNETFADASFVFKWTDAKNQEYKSLSEFASNFLDHCWTAKMISRFMIVQETTKNILIMRPYQVYGAESMLKCALETKNNGFIWHTTGSGKTLTSFKVSQLLAQNAKFKKVFFLVDRRDLNNQTRQEFNQFKEGFTTANNNASALVKTINSTKTEDKFILATIQQFNKALDARHAKDMAFLKDENIVFIIDECHRTQFGEIHKRIRQSFTNAQYFGFTGTPIFVENKSADDRTTADVFGSCLHTYLLKDGIKDKNTLPFSVEYVSTMKFSGELDDPDEEGESVITDEVWHHTDRIQGIVNDIIKDRKRKSHKGKFNAILAVDSVPTISLFMEAFKRANEGLEKDKRLVTATVYSYQENTALEASQTSPKDALAGYIQEYNAKFGTNHSLSEVALYNTDVADRLKKGQIDLLIVANMMLTGFDSKILNTLYVDKNLKYHTLVQAYSRTNRINGPAKPVGHIRCYRNLKEKTDAAIRLFSDVSNANEVLALPYEEQKVEFETVLASFLEKHPTPESLLEVDSELAKKEFVLSFRDLMRSLNKITPFADFDYGNFDIDESDINAYKSHYLEFRKDAEEGDEVSILEGIDFEMETIFSDVINVDYIYNLLKTLDLEDDFSVDKFIHMVEQNEAGMAKNKRQLLLDFLRSATPRLGNGANTFASYLDYADHRVNEIIEDSYSKFGLDRETFSRLLEIMRFHGKFDRSLFDRNTTLTYRQNLNKRDKLEGLLRELKEVFNTDI